MKVGIVTFHCAHNYGAVLQAYATQEFLKSKGFEVYIVDYRSDFLLLPYKPFHWKSYLKGSLGSGMKTMLSKLLLYPQSKKRYLKFETFIRTKLNLLSLDLNSGSNRLDAFVFGSDQIWNPILSRGFNPVYFGLFKAAEGKRKIAYAASMGAFVIKDEEKDFYKQALMHFDAISVREESLCRQLSPWIGKPVKTVVDPTFLVSPDVWEQMAVDPKIEEKFVLLYQVVSDPNVEKIARAVARQIGGIVVELRAWLSLSYQTPYQCASPEEFLGYFKHAACVVTTSFHGTAFSILFQRNFYTIRLGGGHDARSISLLQQLSLDSRLISKDSELQFSPTDYSGVSDTLEQYRSLSQFFLLDALSGLL